MELLRLSEWFGSVVQEVLVGSYDFEARWFGVYEVKSAVGISAHVR